MNPYKGLLFKDFKISRNMFFIWLVPAVLGMIGGMVLSAYTSQPVGTLPVLFVFVTAQFIFAPLMMISMLNKEGKTMLWLYSTRSGMELLLSKLAVIVVYQGITQLILIAYAAISIYWFGRFEIQSLGIGSFVNAMLILSFIQIVIGLFFAAGCTFLWTVYHSFRNLKKPVRWIIIVAIPVAYNLLESQLMKIEALKNLMYHYKIKMVTDFSMKYENEVWSAALNSAKIPVLPFVYFALLAAVLIFLAARLLDRKVEV